MNKKTRKNRAKQSAGKWKEVYFIKGVWCACKLNGMSKKSIYDELVLLGESPNPNAVDKAVGNSSWTNCQCDECGESFEEVITVGQEPDYDSATADVCKSCLTKAILMCN